MPKIISRSEWGARPRRSGVSRRRRTIYLTAHYHGGVPRNARGAAMVKEVEAIHRGGNGWSDIGYNFLIDIDGVIYEGRGWDLRGAHKPSGPGNNDEGIGVYFAIGGNQKPTDAQKRAFLDLKQMAEQRYEKKLKITYHGLGYSTSCPGPHLRAWVIAGCPRPGTVQDKVATKVVTPVVKAVQGTGVVASKITAANSPKPRGPFPLPKGHWYGPNDRTSQSHSGFQKKDQVAIKQIQRFVGVKADGLYGAATKAAVIRKQRATGLSADGLVGSLTWKKWA